MTKKTEMAARAAQGAAARKTPKPVATPLPPWKRSQTGNTWPRTAQRAARASALRMGSRGSSSAAEAGAEPDGGAALEHVEEKGGRAQALAAGAQDVGGADVAAARLADVLVSKEADQQVAGGDGAEQISGGRDERLARSITREFSRWRGGRAAGFLRDGGGIGVPGARCGFACSSGAAVLVNAGSSTPLVPATKTCRRGPRSAEKRSAPDEHVTHAAMGTSWKPRFLACLRSRFSCR